MSYSRSPVLTLSPNLLFSSPPLGFDSAFPPSHCHLDGSGARHSDISISYVYHRRTDSDLIRQTIRSAGGQGRLSGLYNTLSRQVLFFVNNFLWIPFVDTDHHRRTMDPGGVGYFIFFLSIFPDVQGRPNSTATSAHDSGGHGYRSTGVSYFLDQRYPAVGGIGRQRRMGEAAAAAGYGTWKDTRRRLFLFFYALFFYIIVRMRGRSKVMFRDACLGQT